ncbi:hypothetical protein LTR85_000723 [Meristemomyces frigidus]|nr:hypothetical protein LTR85_000723 [Meristemomyces frigidus]
MDRLEHKTLATSPHNFTYSYYLSPDFHSRINPSIPTLVFAHGYPDDAYMWAGAVPHFLELPYPFIILDILGFGGSSKPTDPSEYNYRKQGSSIAQIMDHEKVPDNVIPVGHDWGSAICQRFYLYHRHRCVGLCLVSGAYQPPTEEPFILPEANKVTAQRFGYPQWEYFNFFTAPDAPQLMEANLGRFYECNHGLFPSPNPEEKGRDIWMREIFCTPNAMREYITSTGKYKDYTVPLKPYARDPELKKRFIERLSRDGSEGPVCYYTSLTRNTMREDEGALCKAPNDADKKIDVPVLYVGQTGDWVCRTDLMSDVKEAGLVPDLEEKVVEAGHWVLYEKPGEIAGLLIDWLARNFPVKL